MKHTLTAVTTPYRSEYIHRNESVAEFIIHCLQSSALNPPLLQSILTCLILS